MQLALTAQQAFTTPQVDPSQNAANVLAARPGFGASLPQYTIPTNTGTPYTGDWYTYGQSGHAPMYNAMPMPVHQARGGLIHGYSTGGRVKGFAMGGMPMPGQPPMGAMPPTGAPAAPRNPLATQNGFAIGRAIGQKLLASGTLKNATSPDQIHKIGHAIGTHLSNPTFTGEGQVKGQGAGQDDSVPAKLSVGEFVIPSETVAQLGDGSSDAGGKVLEKFVQNVRQHKTQNRGKFPPKAKNPLSYLPKGAV